MRHCAPSIGSCRVKGLRHPATFIAAVAVALGGGAYATSLISGSRIQNHSIPEKKLTASAIASLRGQRGPAGAQGPKGRPGPKGDAGSSSAFVFNRDGAAHP